VGKSGSKSERAREKERKGEREKERKREREKERKRETMNPCSFESFIQFQLQIFTYVMQHVKNAKIGINNIG